jgi:hypothetical protein
MANYYNNYLNIQIQYKHIIFIFIFILILILILYYNKSSEFQTQKFIEEIANKINKNVVPIKKVNGFIPKPTRCCPDALYATNPQNYIYTPNKNYKYTLYEDNPWTYYKNIYLDDNNDVYKIHRKEGPVLPDRINYPSQYDNCEFKQVGVISKIKNIECDENCCNDNTDIMPLYAKPSKYNRNNYNYYTTNNGNQNLNLQVPIEFKQRNCMEDNGCNEIYDNDIIRVPVFNKNYKVTMYPRN